MISSTTTSAHPPSSAAGTQKPAKESTEFGGTETDGVARPRAVLLDLGEVLVTPTRLIEDVATRIERDPELVRLAYWTRRLEYDLGLHAVEYWTTCLHALGVPSSQRLIDDLTTIDTDAWTTVRPDAAQLLHRLHTHGVRLGILSNATPEMARASRRAHWANWISDWFFSAEIGLAKPDPAIYRFVTRALDLAPGEVVYVDDSRPSVEAAHNLGWITHLWTSSRDNAAFLEKTVISIEGGSR